jgi:hypothetical protein
MKKWGIAALLLGGMFCFVSCPDPVSGVWPGPELSPEGYPIITVGLASEGGERGARALTTDSAKAAVNYYEVIFRNPGDRYTRLAWYKGQTARLAVPPADYNAAGSNIWLSNMAILMAGTNNGGKANDLTLLAVGVLTKVDGAASTNITASTREVTFSLYGLDAAPSTDVNTTSFKITNECDPNQGFVPPERPYTQYLTNAANYPNGLPTASLNTGGDIPYFRIPVNYDITITTHGVRAAYEIPVLKAAIYGGKPLGTFVWANKGGDSSPGTLTSVGVYGGPHPNGPQLLKEQSIITNLQNDLDEGKIYMTLYTARGSDGLCMLLFDLKVSGLVYDVPGGLIWHIRGGMSNYLLDSIQGGGTGQTNTTGGGILLAIGAAGNGIIINPSGP